MWLYLEYILCFVLGKRNTLDVWGKWKTEKTLIFIYYDRNDGTLKPLSSSLEWQSRGSISLGALNSTFMTFNA